MMNGEGHNLVKNINCGFSVKAGDYEGLFEKIIDFSLLSNEELKVMGDNGKSYFEKNFMFENCMNNLEKIMK